VSSARRLLLDESAGERRAVVLLDDRPERLWIERAGEPIPLEAGRLAIARVRRVAHGLRLAFLDLGAAGEAVLPLASPVCHEGATVKVEIVAPPRAGKAAVARQTGPGDGEPRLLDARQDLIERLQGAAPGQLIETGDPAREAADLAEEAVLATEHPLGGGANLAIEATRGLTAVDVDMGRAGVGDSQRAAARVNGLAIAAAARLLRLRGQGGLIVFDLVGRGQDGDAVLKAARSAFAPDMPGVTFGPVSRLGVFHLAAPWRTTPTREQLVGVDGLLTPRTVAQRLARAIEREAARAVRVRAVCAPEVAIATGPMRAALVARLGPRFDIQADPALGREAFEVRSQ